MIPISDILLPAQIHLSLTADNQADGVDQVLSGLNGDSRVQDWGALARAVTERKAPALSCNDCGVCIAHGRTNAVSSLVMAAGRSTKGLVSPEVPEKVRLIFVAGIPSAFDSEYLRIVGAIVRLCRDKRLLRQLLGVQNPEEFVNLLSGGEAKL
ncbi:MAG: PTS sugar transporter subunit IIA [Verrucomicrobiae bacterium]